MDFTHSGKVGDVVYSLPTVRALMGRERAAEAVIHLRPGPNLDRQAIRALLPLVDAQPGLTAREGEGPPGAVDLDRFRAVRLDLARYSIPRYYTLAFQVSPDLAFPWLVAEPNNRYRDHLLISRTGRYRCPAVDYRPLRHLVGRMPLGFVGLRSEYEQFAREAFPLPFIDTPDLAQLAGVLAACRGIVANQSGVFALAEGLKTPRVLEVCPHCPNVVPAGGFVLDALDQRGFLDATAALVQFIRDLQHTEQAD